MTQLRTSRGIGLLSNTATPSEAKGKNPLADILAPLLSYFVFLLWGLIVLEHLGKAATRVFLNTDTQLFFFVFPALFLEMSVLLLQTSSSKKTSSLEQTPSMDV